jgi:hypothetical protein
MVNLKGHYSKSVLERSTQELQAKLEELQGLLGRTI